jgi:hypothetical protein
VPQRFGFLLLPGFHLLELAGALDALGAANAALGKRAYEPLPLSIDGLGVRSHLGVSVGVQASLAQARGLQGLFVVAGRLPEEAGGLVELIRRSLPAALAPGACLGGIGSGAGWLAGGRRRDGRPPLHRALGTGGGLGRGARRPGGVGPAFRDRPPAPLLRRRQRQRGLRQPVSRLPQ